MSKITVISLGVIVVIIVLVLIISFIANMLFNKKVIGEVKKLFASNVKTEEVTVQKSELENLPICVQNWLHYSGVVGNKRINTVRLKQDAKMRLKPDQSWMPVKAEQYFTVGTPGFIWKARIKAAPLFHIAGRDKYYKGKGNMLIKLLSFIKIADSKGKKMDQGTLLRYLAESVWFPSAALSDYISWEEIDSSTARATMSYGGITASGEFKFNEQGEVINFTAERYGEFDGEYSLETWSINMQDYREFSGINIPICGEVTWELESGDFNWFRFEITDIEYNNPVVY